MAQAAKELTPDQIKIAENIAKHFLSVEKFGIRVESDSQDGLNNSEMLGLVFETPGLVVAAKGIIEVRKPMRVESEEGKAQIWTKVGEIIGDDSPNTAHKVGLVFDYVTKMVGTVTTVISDTKTLAKQLRGETVVVRTRKPRTPKVV